LRCTNAATFIFLSLVAVGGAAAAGLPANSEVDVRRAAERRTFSDAEIIDGFLKIAFGAEFRFGGQSDRIRKYIRPVRVLVDNEASPDRSGEIEAVIDDIRTRVKNLDISVTPDADEANAVVKLIHDRDLTETIRALYGGERTSRIRREHEPQCLAGYSKDDAFRIQHAEVILVVDAGDFVFYDCAYEEILQALGPINDDTSLPWSMFNDDVSMGFFDVYDQLLLNILYDPRIRPGMTRAEVAAVLPAILPDVRAFVARTNHLPQ